jgi:hypothetical protein
VSVHLMQVPGWLLSQVSSGSAVVEGALIKDVLTRKVLAHLQPTQAMGNWVFKQGLGSTVGVLTQPLSLVSGVVQNFQLMKLKQMVETLQTVASIGAGASVLGLGVSVGGFAMVLRSLRRVESRVDGMSVTLQAVSNQQRAEFMGRCSWALNQAEQAFQTTSTSERLRYWQEADTALGELTEVAVNLLASQGLAVEGAAAEQLTHADRLGLLSRPEVLDSLRWLMAFSSARTELLLCLGNAGIAAQVAQRSAQWLEPLPNSAKELAQARLAGQAVPPSQMQIVTGLARATSVLVKAGHTVAAERAQLCEWLHAEGVDTQAHMLQLRQDPHERVLAWVADARP